MWSVGTLATTLLGAGLAFYISPRDNLLWVAGAGLIVFLVTSRYLLAPDLDNHFGEPDTKSSMPWFGKAAWPLWILGIGATGTFIAEVLRLTGQRCCCAMKWVSRSATTHLPLQPLHLP